ncbi:FKBP-type peptidyl-prolyl cis-trans isomerase [Ferrimonas marina]|uniref:Peptidyl-prolyl cis-trans isomerase n=1 Tax=Ferrimonas marina TaxID=299255 RepID=A0A1M5X7E9_9GAMM|nr:FKBP-type peptidyl-prolyl cis-trans isomerase [Ferrimonas marina]SHH95757.1 FKBP-type peptidyl-prolyl cis-trans isomerase FkpA [Ferrimonas marina]
MKAVCKWSSVALAVMVSAHVAAEPAFDSDSSAYTMGAALGEHLAMQLDGHQALGLRFDQTRIVKGFADALANNNQLDEEAMAQALHGLTLELHRLSLAKTEQEAQAALEAGQAYLAQNRSKPGVTVTESGVQYEVLQAGSGDKPTAEDMVKVHYSAQTVEGHQIGSTYDKEPNMFTVGRAIPGWAEAMQLMPEGAKYRVVIPSELAYGERNLGAFPANSTLVFEVELLEILDPDAIIEAAKAAGHGPKERHHSEGGMSFMNGMGGMGGMGGQTRSPSMWDQIQ